MAAAPCTLPHFEYAPLAAGHIRLLKPLPIAPLDAHLRFQLMEVPFDATSQKPPTLEYAALSYVWGAETPLYEIEVNNQLFKIRKNLWCFLILLAQLAEPNELIWTDAICINQSDLLEKSCQVRMIGDVFRHAHEVLAWVGDEAGDSVFLMNLANGMQHYVASNRDGDESRWRDVQEVDLAISTLAIKQRRIWLAMKAFFQRPFWSRTWIVQEIALARQVTVFCGSDWADYRKLYGMHAYMSMLVRFGDLKKLRCACGDNQGSCDRRLLVVEADYVAQMKIPVPKEYHQKPDPDCDTLLELMHRYSHTKCKEPKDKIFALLSMQSDIPLAEIDYKRDVHDLYFRLLTRYSLLHETYSRSGSEWMKSASFESKAGLSYCSRLLMFNLHLTPLSLIQWLAHHRVEGAMPKVQIEDATGGSYSSVSSVNEYLDHEGAKRYIFSIATSDWWTKIQNVCGLAADAMVGDKVYRTFESDVGLIIRRSEQSWKPVSWAIVTKGSDMVPNEVDCYRLKLLQMRPLPITNDFYQHKVQTSDKIHTFMQSDCNPPKSCPEGLEVLAGASTDAECETPLGYQVRQVVSAQNAMTSWFKFKTESIKAPQDPQKLQEALEDLNRDYEDFMSHRLWLFVDFLTAVIIISGYKGDSDNKPQEEREATTSCSRRRHAIWRRVPPSRRRIRSVWRQMRPLNRPTWIKWRETAWRLKWRLILKKRLDELETRTQAWFLWNAVAVPHLNESYRRNRGNVGSLIAEYEYLDELSYKSFGLRQVLHGLDKW